jgi:hypothetical protein
MRVRVLNSDSAALPVVPSCVNVYVNESNPILNPLLLVTEPRKRDSIVVIFIMRISLCLFVFPRVCFAVLGEAFCLVHIN